VPLLDHRRRDDLDIAENRPAACSVLTRSAKFAGAQIEAFHLDPVPSLRRFSERPRSRVRPSHAVDDEPYLPFFAAATTESQDASCAGAGTAKPANKTIRQLFSISQTRSSSARFIALPIDRFDQVSDFDHHILFLDRNRERFGLKRPLRRAPSRFHFQFEATDFGAVGFAPRFPPFSDRLPSHARDSEAVRPSAHLIGSRLAGFHEADDAALAQGAPSCGQRLLMARYSPSTLKNSDFPPSHIDQHSLAGRDVIDGCNDMSRHQRIP